MEVLIKKISDGKECKAKFLFMPFLKKKIMIDYIKFKTWLYLFLKNIGMTRLDLQKLIT